MRRLIWPVLFLLLLLVQGGMSVLYHGWLSCDLAFVALSVYSLQRGSAHGARMGFGVGLLQDALTVNLFGYHIISRTVMGYVMGFLKGKVVKDRVGYHVMAVAICSMASRLFLCVIELMRNGGAWSVLGPFWWNAIGYTLGNMLVTLPVLYGIKMVYDWIKEEDISY